MPKRMTVSRLMQNGKRALVVALIGLLLGVVAVPETTLAATPTAHHVTSGAHTADDGVGDSPVMP